MVATKEALRGSTPAQVRASRRLEGRDRNDRGRDDIDGNGRDPCCVGGATPASS